MSSPKRRFKTGKWLVLVGGAPLLAAMFVEFVAVIGRHTGMALLGSIELVQAAILVSSTTAIVIATLVRSHAKVRLLLTRMREAPRRFLNRFNSLCAALFFLSLTLGGVWIAFDMWSAFEQSEILGLPYLPLRCFACVGSAVIVAIYLRRALTRSPR